jgi:hypothetical protein
MGGPATDTSEAGHLHDPVVVTTGSFHHNRAACGFCCASLELNLSLGCTLLDILRASDDQVQRFPIDSQTLLLKVVSCVAEPRRSFSITFRGGVARVRCGARQPASKVPQRCAYLGGEKHPCGGSDQCATEETLQQAAAVAAGGLQSWLGGVFSSGFSQVISNGNSAIGVSGGE